MKFTKKQIKNRLAKLDVLNDFRIGGFLWKESAAMVQEEHAQLLRDLDTARSTVGIALASNAYGPKLRALIEDCLTKELE